MNIDWNALHLVRPQALWLLLALPLIAALWYWRRRRGSAWHSAVDAHLLRHLLVAGGQRAWGGLIALLLGWTLAVVALAGPSWRQVAQPLWQSPAPLVVALDLSSRVTATDLPPSRLLQAHLPETTSVIKSEIGSQLQFKRDTKVALKASDGFSGHTNNCSCVAANYSSLGVLFQVDAHFLLSVVASLIKIDVGS